MLSKQDVEKVRQFIRHGTMLGTHKSDVNGALVEVYFIRYDESIYKLTKINGAWFDYYAM